MFSVRVSIHLTGRCRRRASSVARISSPKTFSFEPKPPPTSGATTLSLSSGMPQQSDSTKRRMCGIWVAE
jgi:hypothetical protein